MRRFSCIQRFSFNIEHIFLILFWFSWFIVATRPTSRVHCICFNCSTHKKQSQTFSPTTKTKFEFLKKERSREPICYNKLRYTSNRFTNVPTPAIPQYTQHDDDNFCLAHAFVKFDCELDSLSKDDFDIKFRRFSNYQILMKYSL